MTLDLQSRPGKGTWLTISSPINKWFVACGADNLMLKQFDAKAILNSMPAAIR
jgi:hypothetical protein